MKKILTVICFFLVNLSLLYAGGKTDDIVRLAAKKLSKEALEAGSKKADDAIRLAAKNADNWVKLAGTHADDVSSIVLRRADDAARLGIKQGDNIIYDFTKVHGRNVASRLATKTDNVTTVLVSRADNAVRAGANQADAVYKRIPRTNGRWSGVPGDSIFFPDLDHVPKRGVQLQQMYNTPQTWKQIGEHNLTQVQNVAELSYEKRSMLSNNFKKFSSGEAGFTYKKGEIDLTPFSYDTIDIRSHGYDRIPKARYSRDIPSGQGGKSLNDLGDELLAKNWNWTEKDVLKYRNDYGLKWHERLDMHTIDLVPNDIHNLITHRGGHAAVNALTQ